MHVQCMGLGRLGWPLFMGMILLSVVWAVGLSFLAGLPLLKGIWVLWVVLLHAVEGGQD